MASGLPISKKHIRNFQEPLKFRKDGTFRILHLTDIHEVHPDMDDEENKAIPLDKSKETLNVIEQCIIESDPDIVIFGGDNISGYWQEFTYEYMCDTIKKIIEPIAKRNIPLAIVFGNHDAEAEYALPFLSREIQMRLYCEYDNFRGTMNDEDVFGCGNYCLPVLSSESDKISWNIWCMDSNDYIRDDKFNHIKDMGYGYVHDDQIKWYEKKSQQIKDENNGNTVPSVLFQHIAVNQECDILDEVSKETEHTVKCDDKFYAPKNGAITCGMLREMPCPPKNHREQFESWKKTGNIVAAFFGHDHVNTFTTEIDSIKLIQTIGAGYHTYGKEHGGRLIVLHENSKDFDTNTIIIDRITDTKF